MPFFSFFLGFLEVADIENSVDEILSNKYFIIDVFPAPDGAEKIMSFPSIFRVHSIVVLLSFPIHLSYPQRFFEFFRRLPLSPRY